MVELIKSVLIGQYEASLCMMNECIEKCPAECWDGPPHFVAKYPFWLVAYHTLCFLDLYLTPGGEAAFKLRPDLHPNGWKEFDDEYPSRRFEKPEIAEYVTVCRAKVTDAIAADTRESLEGPSGFSRLAFSRCELHIYNIRHVQHHTGQLGAFLRRVECAAPSELKWVRTGWR